MTAKALDGHSRLTGQGGRHRAIAAASEKRTPLLGGYRLDIAIGAVMAAATLTAGAVLFFLPSHSAGTLASKCQPGSCHHIAPRAPRATLPAAEPSSVGNRPTASAASATTAEVTTGHAVVNTVTAIPVPSTASARPSPSPSPSPTTPELTPGSLISIRATTPCCTSFYIQHAADDRVVITQITPGDSAAAKADATWIVQSGLAKSSCISFESANDPGQYLRHYDFELYLNPDDGTSQFAQDATFCPQPGNSGQGYSFQSVNYPYKYIRHYNYVVYIASNGGSNPWDNTRLWTDDTTWLVSPPWG